MKRTGKLFVAAVASLLAASATADDKVVVVTASGENSYPIGEVQRIDFSAGALTVLKTDGEGTTYAFDQVKRIVFDQAPTSIEKPAAMQQQRLTLTVSADGSTLRVNGWQQGQSASMELYSAGGGSVARQKGWSGETVDIASLPHGVYIIRVGNQTAKFRK